MNYPDFVEQYESCFHVKSLKKILCGFDNQNDIDATQFAISEVVQRSTDQLPLTVHSVSGSPSLLCVVLESSFGVVCWERSELQCCLCSGILSASCEHVKEVSKLLEDDDEMPDFVELFNECRDDHVGVCAKASWYLRSKSYMAIPFVLPKQLKQVMFETSECQILMDDGGARLTPTLPDVNSKFTACPSCGSAWRADSPIAYEWLSETCNLILRRFILKCFVYYRPCSNTLCGQRLEYDGSDVALLNMAGAVATTTVNEEDSAHVRTTDNDTVSSSLIPSTSAAVTPLTPSVCVVQPPQVGVRPVDLDSAEL
ncbi:uncharacterized protein LOC114526796 [Dendronephthya gigantea]|uniref:uncharacterized protein LOC114526796 n=1 Tax=Dendronephthya gigantea TaxID=151771 RepID=UPI00106ACFD6|nr:uncharacterized protein LOC114526796 [Dendronephthya gigantea]